MESSSMPGPRLGLPPSPSEACHLKSEQYHVDDVPLTENCGS
jgi:hypothetical protein